MGRFRLLAPALLVLSVACNSTVMPTTTTASGTSAPTARSVCAAEFAEFLVEIEPIVSEFDPATTLLSEFYVIADATDEVLGPDLTAAYNCEAEGLSWKSFNWQSAWDEILTIARDHAPGTTAYLQAFQQMTSLDEPAIKDIQLPACDELVADLQQATDEQVAAGNEAFLDMPFDLAIEIITLAVYIEQYENDGTECMPGDLRAQVEAFYPPRPGPATTTSAP
jgi:hypothetical protein